MYFSGTLILCFFIIFLHHKKDTNPLTYHFIYIYGFYKKGGISGRRSSPITYYILITYIEIISYSLFSSLLIAREKEKMNKKKEKENKKRRKRKRIQEKTQIHTNQATRK